MKANYDDVLNQSKPPSLELTETEISSKHNQGNWKYRYPRHIPHLHHKSHRRHWGCINNHFSLPGTCKLSEEQSRFANATVQSLTDNKDAIFAILQSQLKDEKVKQAHLNSVRRNLERRLQAAKASGNTRLIELLKQEWQQLEMSV
jgi:hypothetical protein